MSDDFVTRLQLQLREAALREERRRRPARLLVRARRGMPSPQPLAVALAVAALTAVVAVGAIALRRDAEPAAPRVVGTYRVASGLSELAPGFGGVWTADPIAGRVLRIDPRTHRTVARIPVGGEARVVAGAGAVWAIAGDLTYGGSRGPVRLLRIDPAANRVVARVTLRAPGGRRLAPVGLQVDGRALWALGPDWAMRVDISGGGRDRYVRLGGLPRGIVVDGDGLWSITARGRLRRSDSRTGRTQAERALPQPAVQLVGGPPGALTEFVGRNRLALLDAVRGRVLWQRAFGDDVGYVVYGGSSAWVQHASPPGADRLVRLDLATGRTRDELRLPERGVAGMARVGGELWVATPAGSVTVVR